MRPLSRRWALELGSAAALGLVILLLIPVALGVLVTPASPKSSVTIREAVWTTHQGHTSRGFGWFGPSAVNMTDVDGLPYSIAPGGAFALSLILSNLDSSKHPVTQVTAATPFRVTGANPALSATVVSGQDDWALTVDLIAPSGPSGGTFTVALDLQAS